MAHLVNRRGYYSLEESYRDPITGKPRKRYLRYIGRRSEDPQARMQQMLDTAERKAEAIADRQRAEFGETGAERQSRLKEEAKFSQEKFLDATCSSPAEPAQAPDTAPSESGQGAEAGQGSSDGG